MLFVTPRLHPLKLIEPLTVLQVFRKQLDPCGALSSTISVTLLCFDCFDSDDIPNREGELGKGGGRVGAKGGNKKKLLNRELNSQKEVGRGRGVCVVRNQTGGGAVNRGSSDI